MVQKDFDEFISFISNQFDGQREPQQIAGFLWLLCFWQQAVQQYLFR